MALFYGASPIDLIPDLIPLLGFVDDAAIVPILLVFALFQYKRAQAKRIPVPISDRVIGASPADK